MIGERIYDNNIEDLLEDEEQFDKVVLSRIASKMAGVKCPPDYNPGFCYPDYDCHSCWIGWLKEIKEEIEHEDN